MSTESPIRPITLKAAGWCHCTDSHGDRAPCPGPLQKEEGRETLFCLHCGSRQSPGTKKCSVTVCNRCGGKCL